MLASCARPHLRAFKIAGVRTCRLLCSSSPDRVFRSPLPDIGYPTGVSYPQYLLEACDRHGDRTAITCATTGRKVSYRDLKTASLQAASGLVKLGFKRGDAMCIYSGNFADYPAAMFGIMTAGGVLTTASPDFTAGELTAQLKDCGTKFLLTTKDKLPVAAEAAKASGVVTDIFLTDETAPGTRRFADLLDDNGSCDPSGSFEVDQAREVAAILYSSGTTGLPKGVMLTHRNLVANVEQTLTSMIGQPDEKLLGVLPFYHIYGQVVILAFAIRNGYSLSVLNRFEPVRFLETIQNHGVTLAHIVPPILLFMASHPLVDKYDMSALRRVFCGAAPLKAETEAAFLKRFPRVADLGQGWGLTETSPICTVTPPPWSPLRKRKPGSAGMLVPNVELRICDTKTGQSLGANQVGQIFVRGVNVMKGYFANPKATAESIDSQGWFATGDVGQIDDDGYLFITDRLKELIKVKGMQVAPAELEALLLNCPDVSDVGVVARPDDRAGELPLAFVVLREGSRATEADIQRWLAERVAPYKRLDGGVRFVATIPKAASGKILRKRLRAILAAESASG